MRKSVLRRGSVQTSSRHTLSRRIKPKAIALAVATCFSANLALANPSNPTVVSGTASFAQAGNILNITNSHNAIINWGSFSIGVNELTKFIQPSALSAVLNRVTGQDPSAILGALQSNGRVFLINPNGIVFGAGAQINVAGLVASTLNLSNDDFLNNRMKFTDGAGAGSVVNNGSITGGSVYLVGNAVTNNGLITSPGGEVVLAAGNSVELVNPGTPNLRVEVVAPDNEARNLGTITAEAGRIGIYAGLINNSGTISANSAVAEGGRILLKSTKSTTLESSGVLSARGISGGEIIVLSDMATGVTSVAGILDASASAGNGGFIETSAATVNVANDTQITTLGGAGGQTGMWLIDPVDFKIDDLAYGGNIEGATLGGLLATTSQMFQTSGSGGNIYVNQSVSWSSTSSLTLLAHNNIELNASINNSGTGGINLYAGWDGTSAAATPIVTNSAASILLNGPISTMGEVRLIAGGDITQSTLFAGPIAADRLLVISNFGNVYLNNSSTPNAVNTIAGKAVQSFKFRNSQSLSIGTVNGVDGVSVNDFVEIISTNGAITDGNSGLNISAAQVELTARNGVGTIADPLETQITNYLDVDSSYGGAGIINIGDLKLRDLQTGYQQSGSAVAIGATGALTVDGGEGNAYGDLSLLANGNVNILRNVYASGNLLLKAGGNLTIAGPQAINYGVNVRGNVSTTAVAGGNLSVLPGTYGGYSTLGSFNGLTSIITGGNVLVEQSRIRGNPDVLMTVGGVININGTMAYGGRIEASSPSTIQLEFTNLTSGGFSINGIEGVVYDPVTNTGFFANGDPASIGNGLVVTYSGTTTTFSPPTDTLIVAMGESSKPPDPEKDKDVFEDIKDDKKKEAPVCR